MEQLLATLRTVHDVKQHLESHFRRITSLLLAVNAHVPNRDAAEQIYESLVRDTRVLCRIRGIRTAMLQARAPEVSQLRHERDWAEMNHFKFRRESHIDPRTCWMLICCGDMPKSRTICSASSNDISRRRRVETPFLPLRDATLPPVAAKPAEPPPLLVAPGLAPLSTLPAMSAQ